MNIHRRLKDLEARQRPTGRPSEARKHMTEHLARVAAWRRGELSLEEAAEVEAANAAVERRRATDRGEGRR